MVLPAPTSARQRGLRSDMALRQKLSLYQREKALGEVKPSKAATSVSGRSLPST